VSEVPNKRNFVHDDKEKKSKDDGENNDAVNPYPMSFFQRGRRELAARFWLSDEAAS